MSYDLTIWKWADTARATSDEILEAIGQDEAHPAMQRFDANSFLKDLRTAFGDDEQAPFSLDVADFTGTPANWIVVNAAYSNLKQTRSKLIHLCTRHHLVLFDHQTGEFYGSS